MPRELTEERPEQAAADKKPKKQKARDEIDEIFSAAKAGKKRKSLQREAAEPHGGKRKKLKERGDGGRKTPGSKGDWGSSKKTPGSKGDGGNSKKTPGSKGDGGNSKKTPGGKGKGQVADDDDEEFEEKRPRRRTTDGLAIYSADELGFGKADAGGTPLCPFDCECCF